MQLREVIGLGVAFIVLAGFSVAVAKNSQTAAVLTAIGDAFSNTLNAATHVGGQ